MNLSRFILWFAMLSLLIWIGFFQERATDPQVAFPPGGELVKIENRNIHVVVRGEGRPVVLLHGFPYQSDAFQEMVSKPWPGRRLTIFAIPI